MNNSAFIVLLLGAGIVSCITKNSNLQQILSPEVFTIGAPEAGNYPQSLFKYPYKMGSSEEALFTQTIEWSPAVNKTLDVNTQYTATMTLEPVNENHTFEGTSNSDIIGLPKDGVENITIETIERNLIIQITFKETGSEKVPSRIIFFDDFEGDALDKTKWELCPEMDRQGRSSWRDDMVSLSGGFLRLKFMRDLQLGRVKARESGFAENWIRSGAIRTLDRNRNPIFENGYGYYEARIKFPVASGTWGAFWLMSRTQRILTDEGIIGTEIDIIETINNHLGRYNSALHWNGYGNWHKSVTSGERRRPIDIYDGEFHVFSLDWSPSEYIFYIDGVEFWRVDGGRQFRNSGINQNPNYIKLTVEGAIWSGLLDDDFTEGEMLVDYVRVYNQPQI